MKRFTLNKHERIKSKKTFEALMVSRKSIISPSLMLLYKIDPLERSEPLKVGFSVPKRKIKHAVNRNRIKRRMKESYRKEKINIRHELTHKNIQADVLFIFTSKDIQSYMQINKEILIILGQFLKTLEKYV